MTEKVENSNFLLNSEDFATPQIINGKFCNPKSFVNWLGIRMGPFLRFMFLSKNEKGIPDKPEALEEALPVKKPDFGLKSSLSMTWIGHATNFVNLEGVHFVTDPIWSPRASPLSYMGPIRYRPPPCSIDELPEVHFGVISHNHYDHFDTKSVSELAKKFPNMVWFVPKGLKVDVEPLVGQNQVYELSWGESKTIKFNNVETTVWCVPAQHWSGRGLFDRNKSLWCGWAVHGPKRRFYYTGDTGFCQEEFEKIGKKLGPFDLAAIQIGCYAPRFMMAPQHTDLTESTQIHKLVQAKKSIGIHWGTYDMGSHEVWYQFWSRENFQFYLEPRDKLPKFCEDAGIEPGRFTTIGLGETWTVEDDEKERDKVLRSPEMQVQGS